MNAAAAAHTDGWTLGVIVGLAGVTVLTRCFFFILDRPWGLPDWAHRALRYAPVAALAAVVIPEVVMTQGHLVATWRDARLFAAQGYAAIRIDMRGAGESDGVMPDEYLAQEQQDGVDAIAWIAAQGWCSGKVGIACCGLVNKH